MPGITHGPLSEISDEELMAMLTDACGVAFDEIFARYRSRVISWCFRVTKDYDYATDLAQEVFLKAFRHRASFRGESRLSTWLFSIARNHSLSAVKRHGEETIPLETVALNGLADDRAVFGSDTAERAQLCNRLLRLMRRSLEPLEVQVLTLHYAHDVPLAAITRQLCLTNPSGAKAYIVNARRKLNGIARRKGWENALAGGSAEWPARAAA